MPSFYSFVQLLKIFVGLKVQNDQRRKNRSCLLFQGKIAVICFKNSSKGLQMKQKTERLVVRTLHV